MLGVTNPGPYFARIVDGFMPNRNGHSWQSVTVHQTTALKLSPEQSRQ
jgi:hypothetical protein